MLSFFSPINAPKPGDWLSLNQEFPQTYMKFITQAKKAKKRIAKNNKICIVQLGPLEPEKSPDMTVLSNYAAIFFQLSVTVIPQIEIVQLNDADILVTQNQIKDKVRIKCRSDFSGRVQLETFGIHRILRRLIDNVDCFCLIALTMYDLYTESHNFLFGEADTVNYVGVFSFSRYSPHFYKPSLDSVPLSESDKIKLVWRAVAVEVHELAHMFQLDHCVHFQCVMNGSNHLEESDSQPQHLCPVCLHKLHYMVDFDPVLRYQQLEKFYQENKFQEDQNWVTQMLLKSL